MPEGRVHMPEELRRAVFVEAGHRCAVPTCRQSSTLEVHHIVPYATAQEHKFENLILLCAVCHGRAKEKDIDIKAMRAYKANLGLLKGRYGDLERRVLDYFVGNPDRKEIIIDKSQAILLSFLVKDGLLEEVGPAPGASWFGSADQQPDETFLGPATWRLTANGQDVVEALRSAETLE